MLVRLTLTDQGRFRVHTYDGGVFEGSKREIEEWLDRREAAKSLTKAKPRNNPLVHQGLPRRAKARLLQRASRD